MQNYISSRNILLCLFVTLTASVLSVGQTNNYTLKSYSSDEGFKHTFVNTIHQDKKGQLWLGSADGLCRYDGYSFKTYTQKEGLSDNYISCKLSLGDSLWLGHKNGSITLLQNGYFKAFTSPNSTQSMITDLELSTNNEIWATSYSNGFLRINNNTITQLKWDNKSIKIICFKFINSSQILAGSIDGLYLLDLKNNKIKIRNKVPFNIQDKVSDIIIDKNKNFIVATQNNGLYKYIPEKNILKSIQINRLTKADISGLQQLFLDKNNKLWISTYGNGLYKTQLEDKSYSVKLHFSTDNGLLSNYIKGCYQDREGNMWISAFGSGLCQLSEKSYSYLNFNANEDLDISCIANTDSVQWLGTNNGLYKYDLLNDSLASRYCKEFKLPEDIITALALKNNNIYIGYASKGIYRLNTKTKETKKLNISEGNLENSITSLSLLNDTLWVGTYKGLCTLPTSSLIPQWFNMDHQHLPHNYVNHTFVDTNNVLWVSTKSKILSKFKTGSITYFKADTNNNFYTINAISINPKGDIGIATNGHGLILHKDTSIVHITTHNGLFSDYCNSITYDNYDNLWIGHNGGISQINTKTLETKTVQRNFEITKSITFNTNAILSDTSGNVWMGFNKGLIKIDPQKEKQISNSPVLDIYSVKVNDKEVDYSQNIILSPGKYKLTFEYKAISLSEPVATVYKYILSGHDDSRKTSSQTSVSYMGISEGEYYFDLSATNAYGVKSKLSKPILVIVSTPIWKHPIFFMVIFVVVALLIIILIQRKKRIMAAENKRLEKIIAKRTTEILKQKKEIEIQRDINEEKNKNITDSIRYAKRIQNAVITPIEQITNILPESFLINKPRDIVSGDFCWVCRIKKNKILFVVADCTGHGVPGAFMNILGNTLLNTIVYTKGITSPEEILMTLRRYIIRSLHQDNKSSSTTDSINMGVCLLEKSKRKLHYAGSLHPLVYIHNNELSYIKPDRIPLGISDHKDIRFNVQTIKFKKGDMVYMFSDGFQDQFGGENNKKLSRRRLLEILQTNHLLSIEEQEHNIEQAFKNWKGNNEQTDDMILLGVRL